MDYTKNKRPFFSLNFIKRRKRLFYAKATINQSYLAKDNINRLRHRPPIISTLIKATFRKAAYAAGALK